jgi:heptaprenyl diphosphate synthase
MENDSQNTIKLTTTAMMLGLIMVFSVLESTFTPLLGLPPGVRIGLANIVVMYSLFYINKSNTLMLIILKSAFVLITRGSIAGLLSFSGGFLALLIMILLMALFKDKVSILILSIAGAITHNMGQLFLVSILFSRNLFFPYLPVLLISGITMGILTSSLLKATLSLTKKR